MNQSFRNATASELAEALRDARNYTLALFDCFASEGFDMPHNVPVMATLNPPLWELGHLAWFAEWYVLREASSSSPDSAVRGSLLTKGDDWFDSNTVPHRSRWTLDLPSPGALKTYCHEVLDRVLDKLNGLPNEPQALYPYRLALTHEDMHGEALAYTLQTLGVRAPKALQGIAVRSWAQGEIRFPGGTLQRGSSDGQSFVFDNEKWAHPCYVPAFFMDSTLVSNAQYMAFVDNGGYDDGRHWTTGGKAWLKRHEKSAPRDWYREGKRWVCLQFGERTDLKPEEAVRHVSLYEAQAFCKWAGRRLPTEPEWEYAAMSAHPAMQWGQLWEWTCTPFEPYPGFAPDAYLEYSQPWFGTHQALRGASFATPGRLRSPKFRNFYLPERNDMFAGFRTCAF